MVVVSYKERWFLLLLVISLGLISYISFDAYIRPQSSPVLFEDSGGVSTTRSRILVVSALFPLTKSKHSKRDYRKWLSHFLEPISTDVYFFTTPELEPIVRSVRGKLPITINTSFSTPFDIPPLVGKHDDYIEMRARDRERHRHSPELYAIWNGKPYYLDEAVKNSPVEYDYAFWSDAGSFREKHTYTKWPDAGRVDDVWEEGSRLTGTKKEDLLFFPMWAPPHASMKLWKEDMGPVDNEFIEGSFFGGTPQTISWWRNIFYTYHDVYLSHHFFVGKDQTLINAMTLLFPSRFITVRLGDPNAPARQGLDILEGESLLGSCGSLWFYYQWWLAADAERSVMRGVWKKAWRWRFSWDWWKTGNGCRMAEVLPMTDMLKAQFGNDWTPPERNLVRLSA